MSESAQTQENRHWIIAGFFGLVILAGALFPVSFWAWHYPGLLPGIMPYLFIALSILILVMDLRSKSGLPLPNITWPSSNIKSWALALGISSLMAVLFASFPIFFDIYGDSHFMAPERGYYVLELTDIMVEAIFSFDYSDLKIGTGTVLNLIHAVAYYSGADTYDAFIGFNVFCGFIYVFLWVRLVTIILPAGRRRALFYLIGITAPFLLMFYGHFEIYGPAYIGILSYLAGAVLLIRTRKVIYLILLALLLILNLKFHVTAILQVPTFPLLVLYHFCGKIPLVSRYFNWKTIWRIWLLPMVGLGGLLYVFFTDSLFGPRHYTPDTLDTVIFLPVSSSDPAPLDRYNLFSFDHLSDYFNAWFMWSAAALFLLITIVVLYRKRIAWNQPEIIVIGQLALTYLGFFFLLNPLFGMADDWDLFSIPASILLVLTLLLVAQLKEVTFPKGLTGITLVFCLACFSVVPVNAVQDSLAKRLTYAGAHAFETYWIGSSTTLNNAMNLVDSVDRLDRYKELADQIEPYATAPVDIEYADIVCELGRIQMNQQADYQAAYQSFRRAEVYAPNLSKNRYYLMLITYVLQDYETAFNYAPSVVRNGYPDQLQANRAAIHVAVLANRYEEAAEWCRFHLSTNPSDASFFQSVLTRLQEDPATAHELFSQG